MPGSPNISQNVIKSNSGITIKMEPSSPTKKDIKGSLEALRLGSSRLPSFRGPRDLTLSSLASSSALQSQPRPKRTFVPNIPVRREKGEKVVEGRSERSGKKVPNIIKHERGKGRGRGKEREFIQTKGSLFGEGIASTPSIKKNYDYGGFGSAREGRGGSKAGEMQMPVLNPNAASSIDKEYEESILKEIKRDSIIDDPDEEEIPERDAPRFLPVVKSEEVADKRVKKEELKMEVDSNASTAIDEAKSKIRIKKEPGLEKEDQMDESQSEVFLGSSYNFPKDSVAYSLLSKNESEFIQLQLPTCLPAYPPEKPSQSEPGGSSEDDARPDNDYNVNNGLFLKSPHPRCILDSLPEGKIGNMRIYESGRVELCLGDHVLDISKGVTVGFLQDSVKISVDTEDKTGNMTVLGHVKDRLVATPDFEKIINNIKS